MIPIQQLTTRDQRANRRQDLDLTVEKARHLPPSGMMVLSSEETETGVTRTNMKIRSRSDPHANRTSLEAYTNPTTDSPWKKTSTSGQWDGCESIHVSPCESKRNGSLFLKPTAVFRFWIPSAERPAFADTRCAGSPTKHQRDEGLVGTSVLTKQKFCGEFGGISVYQSMIATPKKMESGKIQSQNIDKLVLYLFGGYYIIA